MFITVYYVALRVSLLDVKIVHFCNLHEKEATAPKQYYHYYSNTATHIGMNVCHRTFFGTGFIQISVKTLLFLFSILFVDNSDRHLYSVVCIRHVARTSHFLTGHISSGPVVPPSPLHPSSILKRQPTGRLFAQTSSLVTPPVGYTKRSICFNQYRRYRYPTIWNPKCHVLIELQSSYQLFILLGFPFGDGCPARFLVPPGR